MLNSTELLTIELSEIRIDHRGGPNRLATSKHAFQIACKWHSAAQGARAQKYDRLWCFLSGGIAMCRLLCRRSCAIRVGDYSLTVWIWADCPRMASSREDCRCADFCAGTRAPSVPRFL